MCLKMHDYSEWYVSRVFLGKRWSSRKYGVNRPWFVGCKQICLWLLTLWESGCWGGWWVCKACKCHITASLKSRWWSVWLNVGQFDRLQEIRWSWLNVNEIASHVNFFFSRLNQRTVFFLKHNQTLPGANHVWETESLRVRLTKKLRLKNTKEKKAANTLKSSHIYW